MTPEKWSRVSHFDDILGVIACGAGTTACATDAGSEARMSDVSEEYDEPMGCGKVIAEQDVIS
jgi:hypothetical protein